MTQDAYIVDVLAAKAAMAAGTLRPNRRMQRAIAREELRMAKKPPINIYEQPGYCLSCFSAHAVEFTVLGVKAFWLSAEHAYQASKFLDSKIVSAISHARSPAEAKAIAHANRANYRPDWNDELKLEIMYQICLAKYQQFTEVQNTLRMTEARRITEKSLDAFWGSGKDDKGFDHLAKIWMRIRDNVCYT
jgi:N-glycosidase YbiA